MRKIILTLGLVSLFAAPSLAQNPRIELFGGYSYGRFNPGGWLTGDNSGKGLQLPLTKGWSASGQLNLNQWVGIVIDGGSSAGANVVDTSKENHRISTIMAGPQLNFRNRGRVSGFVHALGGAAHGHVEVATFDDSGNPFTDKLDQTRPSFGFGGGLDVKVWRTVSARVVQVDYIRTSFANFACSSLTDPACSKTAPGRQNNVRLSTGLVIRMGGGR